MEKSLRGSCCNPTWAVCRAKSFADDLATERGIVNGTVAPCYNPLRLSLPLQICPIGSPKGRFHLWVVLHPRGHCEAEQAAPCDALVSGSWKYTTHAEAVAQAFGANAPKRRCLCAICTKQAMHGRVLVPTERVNRMHHATLCCLRAGSAIHTQLYVKLSDSPSRG